MTAWFFYYFFALMAISCAFWHLRVINAKRRSPKDIQWIYEMTSKVFFVVWGAVAMFCSVRYGKLINIVVPISVTLCFDNAARGLLEFMYLTEHAPKIQTAHDDPIVAISTRRKAQSVLRPEPVTAPDLELAESAR
jgi:hypothetical protein